MIALLWAFAALGADPATQLRLTYTTRFDLPPMADQVCAQTQICDCTVTYEGTGTRVSTVGDAVTFKGTFKVLQGACNEAFRFWVPADGAAYHTLRYAPDGVTITEWIAHAKASDTTRFTSDIKSRGQVWLADMVAVIDPTTLAAMHHERATGNAGMFPITSDHNLTLVLTP